MTISRHQAPTETVITVEGAFDSAAANDLRDLVNRVALDSVLTLDFREVRLFHDSAIPGIAAALSSRPDARVLGLSHHHYRILQYVADRASPQAPVTR